MSSHSQQLPDLTELSNIRGEVVATLTGNLDQLQPLTGFNPNEFPETQRLKLSFPNYFINHSPIQFVDAIQTLAIELLRELLVFSLECNDLETLKYLKRGITSFLFDFREIGTLAEAVARRDTGEVTDLQNATDLVIRVNQAIVDNINIAELMRLLEVENTSENINKMKHLLSHSGISEQRADGMSTENYYIALYFQYKQITDQIGIQHDALTVTDTMVNFLIAFKIISDYTTNKSVSDLFARGSTRLDK